MVTSTDPAATELEQSRTTQYQQDALALLDIPPILFSIQFLGWLTFFPNAQRGHADFRQLYFMGYIVRMGHYARPYDRNPARERRSIPLDLGQ